MRILNEQEKRNALQKLLTELSKSQDILQDSKTRSDYFLYLESIYYTTGSENFRHYYSDIFACLTLIDHDSSLGDIDILAQNMNTLKEGYVPQNKDDEGNLIDISKEIIKLYDHINLDIGRLNYTKQMASETLSELSKAKTLISNLEQKIKESEKARDDAVASLKAESSKLNRRLQRSQKELQNEYVTILGIFAAIVLAFTGGMTFSTSVLENIDKASPYRILAIVFVLGLVLFNLMWLLIDFIRDINGKSIRKWWIILIVDGILIVGLVLTFCAYKFKWLNNTTSIKETQSESTVTIDYDPTDNTQSESTINTVNAPTKNTQSDATQ